MDKSAASLAEDISRALTQQQPTIYAIYQFASSTYRYFAGNLLALGGCLDNPDHIDDG
jgi:hypothetical protein